MKVKYLDNEYTLDLEEIDVRQADVIKRKCGLTLASLEDGLQVADPDALRAVFWLMTEQSGLSQDIELINFKLVKFMQAMNEATEAQRLEDEAKEKAEKKAARGRPTTPKE